MTGGRPVSSVSFQRGGQRSARRAAGAGRTAPAGLPIRGRARARKLCGLEGPEVCPEAVLANDPQTPVEPGALQAAAALQSTVSGLESAVRRLADLLADLEARGQEGGKLLLTAGEAASRLGMSRAKFYWSRARLEAQGLRVVLVRNSRTGRPPGRRYSAESVARLVAKAAQRDLVIG